jgi:hypothetical protein
MGLACASNLAIERHPLTGPYVLAEGNGPFQTHVTVANLGSTKSSAAQLEIRTSRAVRLPAGGAPCTNLVAGLAGTRACAIPALDQNERKSFVLPVDSLCTKGNCCTGDVRLMLVDASGNTLPGEDTDVSVHFGGNGDLSDVSVHAPGEPDFVAVSQSATSLPCP